MGKYIDNVQMCGCGDVWILLTTGLWMCKSAYIFHMKFRAARHTNDLGPVVSFYRDILGLEVIGEFKGHDGYDGVFLGDKDAGWHLEFTVSGDAPDHHFDEDDLLAFYPTTNEEYDAIKQKIIASSIEL